MDGNKEECKVSFSISAWLNPTLIETSGVWTTFWLPGITEENYEVILFGAVTVMWVSSSVLSFPSPWSFTFLLLYCRLYHHSLKVPFCTPTSSVLAEDLVFYTKYIVLCVNCIKVPPFTPIGFIIYLPLPSQRKSCLCSFPRLTLHVYSRFQSPHIIWKLDFQ